MVVRRRICLARLRSLLALATAACLLFGCVGARTVQDKSYELSQKGQTADAITFLDASSLATSSKDRLLYLMERGTLLHLQGAYEERATSNSRQPTD